MDLKFNFESKKKGQNLHLSDNGKAKEVRQEEANDDYVTDFQSTEANYSDEITNSYDTLEKINSNENLQSEDDNPHSLKGRVPSKANSGTSELTNDVASSQQDSYGVEQKVTKHQSHKEYNNKYAHNFRRKMNLRRRTKHLPRHRKLVIHNNNQQRLVKYHKAFHHVPFSRPTIQKKKS